MQPRRRYNRRAAAAPAAPVPLPVVVPLPAPVVLPAVQAAPVAPPQDGAPSPPRSPSPTETLQNAAQISKIINANPGLSKKVSHLLRHGYIGNIEQLIEQLLTRMSSTAKELENAGSSDTLFWNCLTNSLDFDFFTEVICFSHEDYIYLLGPKDNDNLSLQRIQISDDYYASPKDPEDPEIATLVAKAPEMISKETLSIKGRLPKAVVMFRKMPLYFVRYGVLYIGYINADEVFELCTLDLKTFHLKPLEVDGDLPPVSHTAPYDAGIIDDRIYLINTVHTMFSLDITRDANNPEPPSWHRHPFGGGSPPRFNCSVLQWGRKILSFMPESNQLAEFDVDTLEWTRRPLKNSPKLSMRDIHLFQFLDADTLVMVRMSDNSEIWYLDLKTGIFTKKPALGLRSGDYSTNPTLVIRNGVLYVLGGQSVKKHILFEGPLAATRPAAPPARLQNANNPVPIVPLPVAPLPVAQIPAVQDGGVVQPPLPAVAVPGAAPPGNMMVIHNDRKNHIFYVVLRKPAIPQVDAATKARLRNTYDSGYHDVSFRASEKSPEIKAHRAILATNPTFRALFDASPTQSSFVFEDVSTEALQTLVHHFYEMDFHSVSDAAAIETYFLARRYGEAALKVKMFKRLCQLQDPVSSLRLYQESLKMDGEGLTPCDRGLKRKAEDAFYDNMKTVLKTDEFKRFCQENSSALPGLFCMVGRTRNSREKEKEMEGI